MSVFSACFPLFLILQYLAVPAFPQGTPPRTTSVSPARVAWLFNGATHPEGEMVTLNASAGELVFTIVPGEAREFRTESGVLKQSGVVVIAVDLASGQKRWSHPMRFPVLSPLLAIGGKVLVHDTAGNLICLDGTSGKQLWAVASGTETPSAKGLPATPPPGPWTAQTVPAGSGDYVFLRDADQIVCRSLQSGQVRWKSPVKTEANRRAYPALSEKRLYFSTASDDLLCLDPLTGREIWRASPTSIDETIALTPLSVLFLVKDRLGRADLEGAQITWLQPLNRPREEFRNTRILSVKENTAFLASKSEAGETPGITALDTATGSVLWAYAPQGMLAGFSSAGNQGVAVLNNGIEVISLEDGKVRWSYRSDSGEELSGQPLLVAGKLLVSSKRGLLCLDTQDSSLRGWSEYAGSSRRAGHPE